MKAAIVEDELTISNEIKQLLEDWGSENKTLVETVQYSNPISFLPNSNGIDVVFMDIDMPYMNGLDAAKQLREHNYDIIIVFITRLQQYAAEGYSVEALDYLIKPVQPIRLQTLMKKIQRQLMKRDSAEVVVMQKGVIHRLFCDDIIYVEIQKHQVSYHTVSREVVNSWGTLKKVEDMLLKNKCFFKCSSCCIINLKYVHSVKGNTVCLGDDVITVSRQKKRAFMDALMEYIGE